MRWKMIRLYCSCSAGFPGAWDRPFAAEALLIELGDEVEVTMIIVRPVLSTCTTTSISISLRAYH
jgi:hypothetical protein